MKSKKKLVGLVILLAGVALFAFAKYQDHREKTSINIESRAFSGEPAGGATLEIQGNPNQNDSAHNLGKIVGVILMVAGAGVLYFNRKKK